MPLKIAKSGCAGETAMSARRNVNIRVPVLARVEGEGALEIDISGDAITNLKLRIFEPPRYFEKFLEGRSHEDVLDTVARICGICPVAYQMSAVQALEAAFGVEVDDWVRDARRLFYCGEWLQSHSLHVHLLAAPDFLGFDNAIAMAARYPDIVRRGLMLQALGNEIIRLLGARSVHPVGARIGGFWRAPRPDQVESLAERLEAALPQAEALVVWAGTLPVPDQTQPFTSVCLRHPTEYPMTGGRLVSDRGLDIAIEDFDQHFAEQHVPRSTALHCLLDGEPYLVGPLARLNNNFDRLEPRARTALEQTGIGFPSANLYHSLLARTVEIFQVMLEAVALLRRYRMPTQAYIDYEPVAGTGCGCTEAPRGVLWHRYEIDSAAAVASARIVPPTSQNQARIEADLRGSLQALGLDRPEEELRRRGETVIRNYDPCISCATHFLTLKLRR
jgi:sulfhydrogenase subunit alpha